MCCFDTRCTSMKCRFKSTKHVKFGRMIKIALLKVCTNSCYIFFPSLGQFMNTTPVKIFPFCHKTLIEPIFLYLRTYCCSGNAWPIDANKWYLEWAKSSEWGIWGITSQLSDSNVLQTGFAIGDGALSWRKMTVLPLLKFWPFSSSKWLKLVS